MSIKKIKVNSLSATNPIRLFKRKHFMLQDLNKTKGNIIKILSLFPPTSEEVNPHNDFIELLTIEAVMLYSRCFKSSFAGRMDGQIFNHILQGGVENEVTEREFHKMIISIRDKAIAHTDDFLLVSEVGVVTNNDEKSFSFLSAKRRTIEDQNFYQQFSMLTDKATTHLKNEIEDLSVILREFLNLNQIEETDIDLQLIPIPDNVSARRMWGLD